MKYVFEWGDCSVATAEDNDNMDMSVCWKIYGVLDVELDSYLVRCDVSGLLVVLFQWRVACRCGHCKLWGMGRGQRSRSSHCRTEDSWRSRQTTPCFSATPTATHNQVLKAIVQCVYVLLYTCKASNVGMYRRGQVEASARKALIQAFY